MTRDHGQIGRVKSTRRLLHEVLPHRRRRPSRPGRSSVPTRSSRPCRTGGATGTCSPGVYPEEQIVVGVTYNSGLVQAPARVVHPADQPTIVGSFADGQPADDARPARLEEALADGGLEVERRLAGSARDLEEADPQRGDAADRRRDRDERGCADRARSDARARERAAREAVAVARGLGYDIEAQERIDSIHALLEKAGHVEGFDAAGLRGGSERRRST